MKKFVYETSWGNRPLKVEIGEVAKQANASVLMQYGDTVVLSVAVAKKEPSLGDFFPLMVLYQEKLYAAGKIPGGFLRREGRPSEHETLTSRLIDRPLRPLFPEGFKNDVQVINTVLSSDPACPPEMVAMLGSSIALNISDIPFTQSVAGIQIGKIGDDYLINPSLEDLENSKFDLIVAGTNDAVNMVEAGAKEVLENEMLEAILFAHEEIKKINKFQEEIISKHKQDKMDAVYFTINKEVDKLVKDFIESELVPAVGLKEKQERYDKIDELRAKTIAHFEKTPFFIEIDGVKILDRDAQNTYLDDVKRSFDNIVSTEVRRLITVDKIRPDGRKSDEIRPLTSRVGLLPRAHGSSLFTRGQTQALAAVTLGGLGENQIIDGLDEVDNKRFMLHYNFPQYSVGETGRYGSPSRREIGHGALGERALEQVLPNESEFPYTVRVVSEVLESNGSSSQATICAGSMALMQAGVPLKAPVAGIAMGLVMDGKDYAILSDIQGMEDHEGDMDFKVAGTKEGITALQMDIKIDGITKEILTEALEQARVGRLHILEHMNEIISEVGPLSDYAPKVQMITIPVDKIRDVIGGGGKTITQIIEDNDNVKIDIEQDGRVFIMHYNQSIIDNTIKTIENLTREVEVGKIYEATVSKILEIGAIVDLWPGQDGLVHISQLEHKRVEKVEDVVSVGDIILVKVMGIDPRGRIKLSRKEALKK